MQDHTWNDQEFTIEQKFSFLVYGFRRYEADLRQLVDDNNIVTDTDHSATPSSPGQPAGKSTDNSRDETNSTIATLRQELIVLEFCMKSFLSDLKIQAQTALIPPSFDKKVQLVNNMLFHIFESIRSYDEKVDDSLLLPDPEQKKTKPPINYSELNHELEILSLCFEGMKTDYAQHANLFSNKTAEIPQTGSRYIIRSVRTTRAIACKPNYVRTICIEADLKNITTSLDYHWDMLQHNGWTILKNARYDSTLGYARGNKYSCLEGVIQKSMGTQSHLIIRPDTNGGFALCGLIDGKLEEIIMRTQASNWCTTINDTFKFVKVQ